MKQSAPFLLSLLPCLATALPGIKAFREANPQLLDGLISGLTGTLTELGSDVEGFLEFIASSVDQDNLRPEAGYLFQAPGPNDSRGPCPGLNLLANYGYVCPRLSIFFTFITSNV